MCREFRIGTYLDALTVFDLIEEFKIDAHIDGDEIKPSFHTIIIDGMSDKCLCAVTNEEKMKIYDFIDKLSII